LCPPGGGRRSARAATSFASCGCGACLSRPRLSGKHSWQTWRHDTPARRRGWASELYVKRYRSAVANGRWEAGLDIERVDVVVARSLRASITGAGSPTSQSAVFLDTRKGDGHHQVARGRAISERFRATSGALRSGDLP
jgi:hypothetical protein